MLREFDPARRTPALRYGAAVLASGLIVTLALLAEPWLGEPVPTLSFVVPVLLAAWYGGLGPGLLATGIGALSTVIVFIAPIGAAQIAEPADLVRLTAIILAGCLISLLSESLHRAAASARSNEAHARSLASQLKVQAERADRENAAKGHFLTVMSHELRTPLNSISGYVALLENGIHGPINDAQRESLRRIELSSAHLLGLITDILDFARIEAGQVELELQPVTVAEWLAELQQLIEPQLITKQIRYECVPCDPRIIAIADPEKMRQILLNLLSNAIKFTPPCGRIEVGCSSLDERVRICVSDTGAGIPADQLENIFAPFVQVHGAAGTRGGTGLGLAISRDLARALGGEITVESTPGRGSVFCLILPQQA